MTRAEMLAELREVLNAVGVGRSWGDTRLEGYLAEGQDKFCEETGYFRDISNFTMTLQTGIAVYDIPDRVIQILDIWDGLRKLGKVISGSVTSYYDDSGFPFNTEATGAPTMWTTDVETGVIKVYPTPTITENGTVLVLNVWRYSRYDLAGDGAVPESGPTPPAAPEIPSRLQRACIEWACYKAFNHHDTETQDPVKAVDHLNSFNGYVSDGITALRRIQNQETRVGSDPAYRT